MIHRSADPRRTPRQSGAKGAMMSDEPEDAAAVIRSIVKGQDMPTWLTVVAATMPVLLADQPTLRGILADRLNHFVDYPHQIAWGKAAATMFELMDSLGLELRPKVE